MSLTFTFDPGGTTGVAVLDDDGTVLFTAALVFSRLEGYAKIVNHMVWMDDDIVVEVGPEWKHHSPITKKAEALLLDIFEGRAHEVKPSVWKNHPNARQTTYQYATPHERDAVNMGRWWHGQKKAHR